MPKIPKISGGGGIGRFFCAENEPAAHIGRLSGLKNVQCVQLAHLSGRKNMPPPPPPPPQRRFEPFSIVFGHFWPFVVILGHFRTFCAILLPTRANQRPFERAGVRKIFRSGVSGSKKSFSPKIFFYQNVIHWVLSGFWDQKKTGPL